MEKFTTLVEIMKTLRAPGGCPWDAQQDHESIARCVVEEAYELLDAIQNNNADHMREELGDVLLQVIFHSLIAEDKGEFTLEDVVEGLTEKLVVRHPHVFRGERVQSSADVERNWQKIKDADPQRASGASILGNIPRGLPPLLAARKMQSAASRCGFDWKDPRDVVGKLEEELCEIKAAMDSLDKGLVEEEIGDLLFSVVNLARLCGVDPEAALAKTNNKFRSRFSAIEMEAKRRGVELSGLTIEEMDEIWESTKSKKL